MLAANRSLLYAILACMAMGLFAKSLQLADRHRWMSYVFALVTVGSSLYGFWLGIVYARRRRWQAWLAPFINAFLLISFIAFVALFLRLI